MPINGLIIKQNGKCPWCRTRLNRDGQSGREAFGHIIDKHKEPFVKFILHGTIREAPNGQPKD